jgi:hypothetical protein
LSASPSLFSRRALVPWTIAAVTVFVVALYLMAHSDTDSLNAAGPTVQSRSALGYAGIADVMEQIGTPIIHTRSHGRDKLGDGGVLIVAEPRLDTHSMETAHKLLQAKAVLLILPKWYGPESKGHPGWVQNTDLLPFFYGQLVLDMVDPKAQLVRGPTAKSWSKNAIGFAPKLTEPMQFIRSDKLTPIVADGDKILVGELKRKDQRLFVLADPDVIANHSLSDPVNAAFAVALIGALRTGDGPVVFDESLNGLAGTGPNILTYLFRLPLLPGTVLVILAGALLLWSTIPRFGVPEEPAPALQSGKGGLIDNIAALLGFAGQRGRIVGRFVETTVQDVARKLHAPRGLAGDALARWLNRIGMARGADLECTSLLAQAETVVSAKRANPAMMISLARDTNRWKREMIDGPGRNQNNR